MRINENIALAKAILKRNDVPETNEDYLKIRQMVGTEYNYVGILTRLRFVDSVTDLEELKSIFDVLRNSKLDIGKLNRMTYDQILDTFYDDLTLSTNKSKENYELIYKDNSYSFFRVYKYEGILEIGSPAWCLKTKSHWNNYQSKFPEQWVAIDNRYVKSVITPNNSYLGGQYVNNNKTWIRFGVSLKHNDDNTISWVGHNDNDGKCSLSPNNHTFYGILFTIINLSKGDKKSYYQKFIGCENIKDNFFKIVNNDAWTRLGMGVPTNNNDVNYLILSKSYSAAPIILRLRERSFPYVKYLTTGTKKNLFLQDISPNGTAGNLIKDFVKSPQNKSYVGIRIKLGLTTLEEAKSKDEFITQVGKWLVFYWNDDFYIVVDSQPNDFTIPTFDMNNKQYWGIDPTDKGLPIFYFVDTKTIRNSEVILNTPESKEILNYLSNIKQGKETTKPIETEDEPGFIKRFLGFK
jgi:hypothetical protein